MEPMKYDEGWIVAYAMALEQKAQAMVTRAWMTACIFGLIGFLAMVVGSPRDEYKPFLIGGIAAVTFVLGLILSNLAANRAAMIRLQAHTALCQVQIERNTRK